MDLSLKVEKAEAFFDAITAAATRWSIPDGHVLHIDRAYELAWNMGYPSRSVSATIRRAPMDPNDPSQVHIEIRYFLDQHRATIFAEHGQRWFGKFQTLLHDARDIHPRAQTLDGLMLRISGSVRQALENAQYVDVMEAA